MMIHHMLSVARRATPPSGASLAPPAAALENVEPAGPPPSPADGPPNIYRPASALATVPVTIPNAGSQVALPAALAAYQEFAE
jgi:hypothetical protein